MATYPHRWESDVVLADGGTMAVRPIRSEDGDLIRAFHDRQSPESIYFRFFSPRPQLSNRDVERFTTVDYVDRMAFVGLLGDRLVGIARYDRHRGRSDAEVAFFVDDEHNGRGIATVLLEYLAVAAREVGITGFTASVLPQNRKMLGVFTAAGFHAHSHFEDGVIEVELGIESTPEALAAIESREAHSEARSVRRLLNPRSVVVVGASRDPDNIGHQVFHQLVSRGFEGPVYPVNRVAEHVASVRAWHSVLDVPGEPDLAIVCVPADEVRAVVEECAIKRVRGLVILSAGFADRDDEGEARERELVAYARRHGMRIIGPNALGVINTDPAVRLHGTFVPVDPRPGRVGLVAQSGVIGAAIIDAARVIGVGISSFVAVGNKADLSSNDLLRYWHDDPGTDVAMLYLESFGNPSAFVRTARALSAEKPIVAVKVGGAPADDWDEPDDWPPDATSAALLEQTGIVRVDNLTQMLHTASVLAHQPLPAGDRVAVVTNSWGPAWLAVDALRASGLEAADLIDLSNEAGPGEFGAALRELYAADACDAVLVIYAPAMRAHYRRTGAAIRAANCGPGAVTTVACLLGTHAVDLLADGEGRVPEFPFPEEAADSLARVHRYAAWRRRPAGDAYELTDDDLTTAQQLVAEALGDAVPADPARVLDVDTVSALLATTGLAPVDQVVVHDVEAAVRAADDLGYPIALKAGGLAKLAKTEAGGVSLDVHGADEVRRAYARMAELLGSGMEPAVVQRMAPEGAEAAVGIHRHLVLGDVLTLGPGGAAVEGIADQELQILPLTDADAERLLDRSSVGAAITAQGTAAREAFVEVLLRISALASAVPEIVAVRLNPVLIAGTQAALTDARISVRAQVHDPRPTVRRL